MKAKNNKTSKNQSTKKKNIVEIYETEHKKPHGNKRFTDPTELKKLIDEYFDKTDKNVMYKNDFIKGGEMAGQIVEVPINQPYTVLGLCQHLNILHQTYLEYMNDENEEIALLFNFARERITNQLIKESAINNYNAGFVSRLLGIGENTNTNGNIEHKVTKIIFE